ncbi:hypothetical protein CHS0354_037917 [Potamilus streckersoni]|uniref:Uncharacterized protein n=1 Tax=Potamilus streckersoni TaxID=2493646 RepID=A0AAE0W9C6_9BIVA|nr:hypothetical protein CHS0354_037917 [Potamilus streckersoni]
MSRHEKKKKWFSRLWKGDEKCDAGNKLSKSLDNIGNISLRVAGLESKSSSATNLLTKDEMSEVSSIDSDSSEVDCKKKTGMTVVSTKPRKLSDISMQSTDSEASIENDSWTNSWSDKGQGFFVEQTSLMSEESTSLSSPSHFALSLRTPGSSMESLASQIEEKKALFRIISQDSDSDKVIVL